MHARADDLRFGKALAYLPDRDGDGCDDLLVGASRSSQAATWAGAVLMFAGTAGLDTVPDLVLTGEAAGDEFGYAIDAGGDFNGDGWPDIAVGAPFANPDGMIDGGRAYVFLAGPELDAVPDLRFAAAGPGERFGTAVALGFDWDDDGFGDLAVGAPDRAGAGPFAGAVEVFRGGAAPDSLPDVVIDDAEPELHLGTTVTAGGDLLGNGQTTLCIGGYNAVNEGTVRLYGRDAQPVATVPPPAVARGRLAPPWPNPANPRIRLALDVDVPGRWLVEVVDLAGRRLAVLHQGPLPAGRAVLRWDGRDARGLPAASGVYAVRATSGRTVDARRFTLVR
ncbi:MAG: hypothetical protein LC667_16540 [Thioalkalivibrio sp.]|nr:hypothetical protein [Thioalkalivibrio sp.]